MKVKKWVEFEKEIDVGMEDILAAIAEDPDSRRSCLRGVNNFYMFMQAVSAEVIATMTDFERVTISKFLRDQAERFENVVGSGTPAPIGGVG
jgi:hypothetical protein